MNRAETAVLNILAPGGILTTAQLQRDSSLTGWRARNAIARLHARGLIVATRRGRWQLSARGRAVLGLG